MKNNLLIFKVITFSTLQKCVSIKNTKVLQKLVARIQNCDLYAGADLGESAGGVHFPPPLR